MDLQQLVEPDRVHKSVYTDPAIFKAERERVFLKHWFFLTRAEALKDAIAAQLAADDDSVLPDRLAIQTVRPGCDTWRQRPEAIRLVLARRLDFHGGSPHTSTRTTVDRPVP